MNQTKRHKKIRIWTAQDEHLIKKLAGTIPINEIAQKLNRTRASVLGKAHLMQISLFHVESHPLTRYPQSTYQKAMDLYDQGWSCTSIAKDLGLKRSIVSKWATFACRTGIRIAS